MIRRFTPVALAAAILVVGACGRADNTTYDTAAGTVLPPPPPAYTPTTGMSVGATTGATTQPIDTLSKQPPG